MPRRSETKHPKKVIIKALTRHLEGSAAVVDITRDLGVSRATFYNWQKAYKADLIEQSKEGRIAPSSIVKSSQLALIAELQSLRLENRRLRDKLITYMVKAGEI